MTIDSGPLTANDPPQTPPVAHSVSAARATIIGVACKDLNGRAILKTWLRETANGDIAPQVLEALQYKSNIERLPDEPPQSVASLIRDYRSECLDTSRLCDSVSVFARAAVPTYGIAYILKKNLETLQEETERLSASVSRLFTGDDRLLGLAIFLEPQTLGPDQASLRQAGQDLQRAGAKLPDMKEIALRARMARPADPATKAALRQAVLTERRGGSGLDNPVP